MIAHAARAVLGRRHVGDVGLRDGDVRGGDAAPDARATSSSSSVGARPSSAIPTAVAAMLQSSTGRRPTRSESRPQIGMNRNCMTE